MTTAPLPAAPSLEQLRNRARDLQRAHRAGDADARARVAAQSEKAPDEPLKLSAAQLTIAREHGFPSWPRLRAYVERVTTHGPDLQHAYHDDLDYYAGRAYGLLASAQDGTPGAVAAFERHGAPATLDGARTVVARMHGFPSWPALRRHVASLRDSDRNGDAAEPFARAYRALEARDTKALADELDRFPGLATASGTNGNDLLGMATATGDERTVQLLLERGADPGHQNAHGWTPLHQTAYSNQTRLAEVLLDAGAPAEIEARGEGGTPLVAALFWGNRATAELLAVRGGITPRNLRTAAGLGRTDLIAELVGPDGTVAPEATRKRGFYRPHSGFPAWRPSDDPQEALDEALAWAARSDRLDALDLLVQRGARLEADVYRGTALAWAAASGRAQAAARLIALGADPSGRTTFGGPDHGQAVTPLHLAAQNGDLETIEALLDNGADPTVKDGIYDGTPADWAANFRHTAARDRLATAARPGGRR
jgi:ankyrin repeat protein